MKSKTEKGSGYEKVRVVHMKSPGGKNVANQYVITTEKGQYFQSHDKIVAYIPFDREGDVVLDRKYWNMSKTTSKYRNSFLHEKRDSTQLKIREGIYKLADLNG